MTTTARKGTRKNFAWGLRVISFDALGFPPDVSGTRFRSGSREWAHGKITCNGIPGSQAFVSQLRPGRFGILPYHSADVDFFQADIESMGIPISLLQPRTPSTQRALRVSRATVIINILQAGLLSVSSWNHVGSRLQVNMNNHPNCLSEAPPCPSYQETRPGIWA